jgi:hypothetical protein
MDQWPVWCKSDEAGGYKGLLCSGAPIGPRGFVRGVVGQLVHKCNSDATKFKMRWHLDMDMSYTA